MQGAGLPNSTQVEIILPVSRVQFFYSALYCGMKFFSLHDPVVKTRTLQLAPIFSMRGDSPMLWASFCLALAHSSVTFFDHTNRTIMQHTILSSKVYGALNDIVEEIAEPTALGIVGAAPAMLSDSFVVPACSGMTICCSSPSATSCAPRGASL